MNKFVKRQLRTTFLLLLALVLILGSALYLRWSNSYVEIAQPTSATQEDLAEALIRYKRTAPEDAARLRTQGDAAQRVELAFTGMANADTMGNMVQLLASSGITPTFYLTTAEAANYNESIELLLENGCSLGLWNASLSGDPEALVEQFCRTSVLIRSHYGVVCQHLLTTATPADNALRAAAAVGVTTVNVAQHRIDLTDCTSLEAVQGLLENIPQGSLVQVHINATGADPAPGLACLLEALNVADPLAPHRETIAVLDSNSLPTPLRSIHTTEEAVCLTFSGLGNTQELTLLLSALQAQNARATFFVDHEEAQRCQEDIRRILAAGHELGIKPAQEMSTDEAQLLYELTLAEDALHTLYGCEGKPLVRSGLGRPGTALIRAAAAGGYTLISNNLAPMQPGDERATDATDVLNSVLREGGRALQRGEILHLRMNFYQYSDSLLSELVTALLTQRSVYPAKALSGVLGSDLCYTYPLPEEAILPQVKDRIHLGQFSGDVMEVFPQHYVGVDWINSRASLPGFTDEEIAQLDTTGVISTNDNLVFLTFDDWGSDANLTHILQVLRKHNAKATFFIYTENVANNPNLLRAIALEGHAIASHTHYHIPLSNPGEAAHTYVSLRPEQIAALREDLVLSYQTLQSIIGDIAIDGTPALMPYFRPPTLALSREGVATVFDAGYSWIVSGSASTDDYIATDVASLTDTMLQLTESGAVLVMHMTDSSIYTADALDAYLESVDNAYRFATLSEVLEAR
ncbi:MAG: polysaccharide deacetylase family protein [Clostridia bacterium]|nr:polysaccharide deacetylase family protein [Clostridia bacterium]